MVKPYSEDLRRRVIAAVEEDGLSRREAARRYRVGESTAVKWLSAFHGSGRMGARPMGGDRRSVLNQERAWLAALIGREKNLTLALISERQHDLEVSARPRVQLQKKRCTPPSREGLMLRFAVASGGACNTGSIRGALCSLTRPGSRRT